MKKNDKTRLFEVVQKLDKTFKPKLNEEEMLQERLTTHSIDIHGKLSKVPELKRLNLWSTASSMVGLYRYEPDGYAYEIEIRPVEIGRHKELWGNQIKKREDRINKI
jgi:hypothetical protein